MSVVSVRELFDGRGGGNEGALKDSAKRRWRVLTNSAADNKATIQASGMLPIYLSFYPGSTTLTRRNMTYTQEAGATLWIAEAEYSSTPLSTFELTAQAFTNPLQRPVRVSGEAHDERRVPRGGYFVDPKTMLPGKTLGAIYNSAGDQFDSLPEEDESVWSVHFALNVYPMPSWFFDYQNTTNNASVSMYGRNFPRGTLRFANARWGELQQEWGISFWTIEWDLQYKRAVSGTTIPGWYYALVDRGYTQLSGSTNVVMTNSDGTRPSAPLLLDGLGHQLANPTTAQAVWRAWATKDEVDFRVLPAPPTS